MKAWLDSGQACGEPQRLFHRTRAGSIAAGYLKRRAVVGRCPDKRQAQRHVDAAIEIEHLERRKALIMIHGHYSVQFIVIGLMEYYICGPRPCYIPYLARGLFYSWRYDAGLLGAHDPAFPRVRVEAGHAYPWRAYLKISLQGVMG